MTCPTGDIFVRQAAECMLALLFACSWTAAGAVEFASDMPSKHSTESFAFSVSAYGSDSEPNDLADTAIPMSPNSTYTSQLGFNGITHDYVDYYRLTFKTKGSLHIAAGHETTLDGSFSYALYASDGRTAVPDMNSLAAGDYLLRVSTDSLSAYGVYWISTTFATGLWSDSIVPSTTYLAFDDQEIGSTRTQTVTLTNVASTPKSLSISVSQAFFVQHDCDGTLAPSASCTLTAGFTPIATGASTGNIGIAASSDPLDIASPLVLLSGNGLVTLNPTSTILVKRPVVSAQWAAPTLVFAPVVEERNGLHNLYVAGLYEGQYYFATLENGQTKIVPYTSGDLPVYTVANGANLYASDGHAAQTWEIALGDLSRLRGLQIYAGFGRSAEDMLNKGQVKLIYTVD